MDPATFPDPQSGMRVLSVICKADVIRIVTTGADIRIHADRGEVRFGQRIGPRRDVAVMSTGRRWRGAKVTHRGPGLARITFSSPALTVRINGDSLFMLHTEEPLEATVTRCIEPVWNASYLVNHLIADELGGFGVYCSDTTLDDGFDAYEETVAIYRLPTDAVLWLGVCPPKPYPWERSIEDHVVWHWSAETGYPPDEQLRSWRAEGNTVLLQSEVMLWEDWNLDFVPRLGEAEFARVRSTIHDAGMRFMVYTSPFFFLAGTPHEDLAFSSWDEVNALTVETCPGRGQNMGLFMEAIERVMRELQPDGLYFDGQYLFDPAALYALARRSREIVGEDGLLEWHSTAALGLGNCYLPQADAYVDYILRGEGWGGVSAENLRFFVSGYNISNSIGVLCNNITMPVTPELVRDVLEANARLHTPRFDWLDDPAAMAMLEEEYRPKLTHGLHQAVEAATAARQENAPETAARAREADRALREPPEWGGPAFTLTFDDMPEAEQVISPANAEPFAIEDGRLHVRAHGNTYAHLRLPLDIEASGFVVKIRHGTDAGMAWGPALLLRWQNGSSLRLGTRSDRLIQGNIHYAEILVGEHDPAEWIWLRARWNDRQGIIESSTDGQSFERIHTFSHAGALCGETAELLIGKVPPGAGALMDHAIPGEIGEAEIDFVGVYAR